MQFNIYFTQKLNKDKTKRSHGQNYLLLFDSHYSRLNLDNIGLKIKVVWGKLHIKNYSKSYPLVVSLNNLNCA